MALSPSAGSDDLLLNRWAGRITLLALIAILFATLFPYQFFFSRAAVARLRRPVSAWLSPTPGGLDDIGRNVFLFRPLGFGISIWLRRRGTGALYQPLAASLASLVLSFTIEILQNFLPGRDPSWVDVLTNMTGGTLG